MNPNKPFYFLLIFAFTANLSLSSQNTLKLNEYNCFSVPVKYVEDAKTTKGTLLFINHTDKTMPLTYTNVYLLNKNGKNTQLIGDSTAFTGVNEISVSPDNHYLAIFIVSEGHPWIEVYDLQDLIGKGEKNLVAEINPYPGSIAFGGWQSDKIIINSDIDLAKKNTQNSLLDSDIFEKDKIFYYDLKLKRYSRKE